MSVTMPEAKMDDLEQEHYECCPDHPQAPLSTLQSIEEEMMGVRILLEVKICSECKDVKWVRDRKFLFLLEVYKNDEPMYFVANKSWTIGDARRNWLPEMPDLIQGAARSLSDATLKEEQVLNTIIVSINSKLRELADYYKDDSEQEPRE